MHIYLRTLGSVLITSMKRLGCGFWRLPVTTTPMRMLLLKAAEEHERIANSEQRSAPKTLTRVEVEDPPAGLRERRARGRPFGSVSDTGKPLASAGKWEDLQMKRAALAVLLALGGLALAQPAHAVVCAPGSIGPAASDPMGPQSFTGHITIGRIPLPALPEYTEPAAPDRTARSFADDTKTLAQRSTSWSSRTTRACPSISLRIWYWRTPPVSGSRRTTMNVSPRWKVWPNSGVNRTFCPTANLCAGISSLMAFRGVGSISDPNASPDARGRRPARRADQVVSAVS
jgi:hypothetical protein